MQLILHCLTKAPRHGSGARGFLVNSASEFDFDAHSYFQFVLTGKLGRFASSTRTG